jgi:hypothetical protein
MLPKHGFWPLNYIPFMLLEGIEPTQMTTTFKVAASSIWATGASENLILLEGFEPTLITTTFEVAASSIWAIGVRIFCHGENRTEEAGLEPASCRFQRAVPYQLGDSSITARAGFEPATSSFSAM